MNAPLPLFILGIVVTILIFSFRICSAVKASKSISELKEMVDTNNMRVGRISAIQIEMKQCLSFCKDNPESIRRLSELLNELVKEKKAYDREKVILGNKVRATECDMSGNVIAQNLAGGRKDLGALPIYFRQWKLIKEIRRIATADIDEDLIRNVAMVIKKGPDFIYECNGDVMHENYKNAETVEIPFKVADKKGVIYAEKTDKKHNTLYNGYKRKSYTAGIIICLSITVVSIVFLGSLYIPIV